MSIPNLYALILLVVGTDIDNSRLTNIGNDRCYFSYFAALCFCLLCLISDCIPFTSHY